MGEVIDISSELLKDNPKAPRIMVEIFADSLRIYSEAARNVREHGAIVSHPRTGSPIENPYLKVMISQSKFIQSNPRINADRVFSMIREENISREPVNGDLQS